MLSLPFLALIVLGAIMGPAYALILGSAGRFDGGAVFSLAVSIALVAMAFLHLSRPESRKIRLGLALAVVLCLPAHYGITGKVISAIGRPRADEALMEVDRFLLGWLFPQGQISLWFDSHPWLGPATTGGKLLADVMQAFYFSYYWWGFGLLGYLAYGYARAPRLEQDRAWKRLELFLCAWMGAYLVNFICYVIVPAIGPRYFYPQLYVNKSVDGFGLAHALHSVIVSNQATSEDCFPSGHTALSWITALMALRFAPRYGRVAAVAAAFITLATLVLRYHYVADVLAASGLVALGLAWGGWFGMAEELRAPARLPSKGRGRARSAAPEAAGSSG